MNQPTEKVSRWLLPLRRIFTEHPHGQMLGSDFIFWCAIHCYAFTICFWLANSCHTESNMGWYANQFTPDLADVFFLFSRFWRCSHVHCQALQFFSYFIRLIYVPNKPANNNRQPVVTRCALTAQKTVQPSTIHVKTLLCETIHASSRLQGIAMDPIASGNTSAGAPDKMESETTHNLRRTLWDSMLQTLLEFCSHHHPSVRQAAVTGLTEVWRGVGVVGHLSGCHISVHRCRRLCLHKVFHVSHLMWSLNKPGKQPIRLKEHPNAMNQTNRSPTLGRRLKCTFFQP